MLTYCTKAQAMFQQRIRICMQNKTGYMFLNSQLQSVELRMHCHCLIYTHMPLISCTACNLIESHATINLEDYFFESV